MKPRTKKEVLEEFLNWRFRNFKDVPYRNELAKINKFIKEDEDKFLSTYKKGLSLNQKIGILNK